MAQKIETHYVDDIDGSAADGSTRFALDGTNYEIDLSDSHREALHRTLEPYIAHARKVSASRRPARGRRSDGGGADTAAVRAWAREHGIEIKERGRIPADVVAQYRQATGR